MEKDKLIFRKANNDEEITILDAKISELRYGMHAHDDFGIGITKFGNQHFRCNGVNQVAKPSGIIQLNPEDLHDGFANEEEGYSYHMIYLPRSLVYELSNSEHSDFKFNETIKYDIELYKALERYINEANADHDSMYLDGLFNDVMTLLINKNGSPAGDLKVSYANEVIDQSIQYMYNHLDKKITIDELSFKFNLSKYHFIRLFKKVTGITPHQYLLTLRLEYARKDLEMGFQPIGIAIKYGFHDLSHFINRFKMAYGVTPGKYQSFFLG